MPTAPRAGGARPPSSSWRCCRCSRSWPPWRGRPWWPARRSWLAGAAARAAARAEAVGARPGRGRARRRCRNACERGCRVTARRAAAWGSRVRVALACSSAGSLTTVAGGEARFAPQAPERRDARAGERRARRRAAARRAARAGLGQLLAAGAARRARRATPPRPGPARCSRAATRRPPRATPCRAGRGARTSVAVDGRVVRSPCAHRGAAARAGCGCWWRRARRRGAGA